MFFKKKIISAVTAEDTDLNQHVMNVYANEEGEQYISKTAV